MQMCGSPFSFLLPCAEFGLVTFLELVSSRIQAVAARRSRSPLRALGWFHALHGSSLSMPPLPA